MQTMGAFNVTQSSMVNSVDSGALLFMIIAICAVIGLILLITSIERYTSFFKALEWIYKSIRYTLYGAGVSASAYVLYLICGAISVAGSGIKPMDIVIVIGGYILLTAIGFGASKIYTRAKNIHEVYKKNKLQEQAL